MSLAVGRRAGASEDFGGRLAEVKTETWLLKLSNNSNPHVRAKLRLCVSCMSFSHFQIGFLSPPSSRRPSPASCSLFVRPLFCPVVSLLLLLSLPLSRYLKLWFDVGLDGTASVAVFVPCSRHSLPTGSPTCVAAAAGTWSALMGAPFGCPRGRSPIRSPSRNKTEQHQRVLYMDRQLPVIVQRLAQFSRVIGCTGHNGQNRLCAPSPV